MIKLRCSQSPPQDEQPGCGEVILVESHTRRTTKSSSRNHEQEPSHDAFSWSRSFCSNEGSRTSPPLLYQHCRHDGERGEDVKGGRRRAYAHLAWCCCWGRRHLRSSSYGAVAMVLSSCFLLPFLLSLSSSLLSCCFLLPELLLLVVRGPPARSACLFVL